MKKLIFISVFLPAAVFAAPPALPPTTTGLPAPVVSATPGIMPFSFGVTPNAPLPGVSLRGFPAPLPRQVPADAPDFDAAVFSAAKKAARENSPVNDALSLRRAEITARINMQIAADELRDKSLGNILRGATYRFETPSVAAGWLFPSGGPQPFGAVGISGRSGSIRIQLGPHSYVGTDEASIRKLVERAIPFGVTRDEVTARNAEIDRITARITDSLSRYNEALFSLRAVTESQKQMGVSLPVPSATLVLQMAASYDSFVADAAKLAADLAADAAAMEKNAKKYSPEDVAKARAFADGLALSSAQQASSYAAQIALALSARGALPEQTAFYIAEAARWAKIADSLKAK